MELLTVLYLFVTALLFCVCAAALNIDSLDKVDMAIFRFFCIVGGLLGFITLIYNLQQGVT